MRTAPVGRVPGCAPSLLWLCLLCGLAGCAPAQERPNILLYVVDTLRADSLAPYGNPVIETPAATRLAREGTLYERAYAHSSWTRPSIASLLTGRLPGAHRVEGRRDRAAEELRFLPEALAEVGYHTGAIVTNPNVGAFFGFDQGFEEFVELFDHDGEAVVPYQGSRARSDAVTRRAIEWIDSARRPFFLFVLATDPHNPYTPPPGFRDYAPGGDPRPRGPSYRRLPNVERKRARYYGEVAFNDRSFGSLLDHLQAAGLRDETLVVLTSDHGEEFGEHGSVSHGKTLFEEQLRVPLIIRRPREPRPGRRVETPVQLVDLHATLLRAARVAPEAAAAGIELPASGRVHRRTIHARLALDGYESEMVLSPPWKWIAVDAQPADDARQLGGLFDLVDDPFEGRDLRNDRPDRVAELAAALEERRRRERELAGRPSVVEGELAEDVRAALEKLGYLEPGQARATEPDRDPGE